YLLLSAFLLARSFHLFLMLPPPPRSTLFPYTTLFRSLRPLDAIEVARDRLQRIVDGDVAPRRDLQLLQHGIGPPGSEHVPGEERSEEHTSELQSRGHLVCRLLLEKKKCYDEHGYS